MKKKVSIWIGKFEKKEDFDDFIREEYTDEGDMFSKFINSFKIENIDNQFQEAAYLENNLTINSFSEASYSESFIGKLTNYNFLDNNCVILLYDFEYDENVSSLLNVKFIGVYDYLEE